MGNLFQIEPEACILGAFLLLTLPLDWLLAAFLAAAFHECCHAVAVMLLGGKIQKLRVGMGGAVLDTRISGTWQELLSAAAGPAGSLLLLLLRHVFPKLAVCALIQGLFNLLPLYPMDGGRMLRCGLEMLCPEKAERIWRRMEKMLLIFLLVLGLGGTGTLALGPAPMVAAIAITIRAVLRKRPCKRSQIGVQ